MRSLKTHRTQVSGEHGELRRERERPQNRQLNADNKQLRTAPLRGATRHLKERAALNGLGP